MTGVASSLVDHVNQNPAKVDRSPPERCDSRNVTQRVELSQRVAASFARRRVQLDDALDTVVGSQSHCAVGIVGAGHVPGCGHLHAEQPTWNQRSSAQARCLTMPAIVRSVAGSRRIEATCQSTSMSAAVAMAR